MKLLSRTTPFALTFGFAATLFGVPKAASADNLITPCASVPAQADGTARTATPCVASRHQTLVELGYGNTTISGNGTGAGAASYPQAAIRYGLSDSLEVDAAPSSTVRTRFAGSTAHGIGDASLGLRYRVLGTGRAVASVIGDMTLPTGDVGYGGGKPQYALGAAGLYALTPMLGVRSSITYTSNYQTSAAAPSAWYSSYRSAVAFVTGAPAGTSFYIEGSHDSHVGAGLGAEYKLGAGVRRKLGSSTVLEVGADDGITLVNGFRSHAVKVALTQSVR